MANTGASWCRHPELLTPLPDLDTARLEYSYKRTCVVTLTVGPVHGNVEWHLPTYDLHNQNKYHYKLHALDMYFWTQHDALAFVNGIRRVLPPAQCTIADEPGPPPRPLADVSAVVQRLEKAAITTDDASSARLTTPASSQSRASIAPPLSALPNASSSSSTRAAEQQQQQQQQPAGGFVPMAYNPAAPAAPEHVYAREKTPPPPDGAVDPLLQTLAHDAATPFSPGLLPPGVASFPGPPWQPQNQQHHVLLHGHPGLVRAATVPVQAGLPSPALASPSPHGPGAYGAGAGVVSVPPGFPAMASPGLPPAAASLQGGQQQPQQQQLGDYGVHAQYYAPESAEPLPHKPKKEMRGRLEENAGRLERGVTGMLRKFEKRFG